MNVSEEIRKARTLLDFVPHGTPKLTIYDVPEGTCLAEGLLKIPHVAIENAFMSAGTTFPDHGHDVIEWLIVYRGALQVRTYANGRLIGECDVLPGGGVSCAAEHTHEVIALRDTWMAAITIPASAGYARHG